MDEGLDQRRLFRAFVATTTANRISGPLRVVARDLESLCCPPPAVSCRHGDRRLSGLVSSDLQNGPCRGDSRNTGIARPCRVGQLVVLGVRELVEIGVTAIT